MSLTTCSVPRKFKPLSRSAWRYAKRNGIDIRKLGPKQKRWVDALLSGNFKKAKAQLCTISSNKREYHCCLGVACELVPGIKKEKVDNDSSTSFSIKTFDQYQGDLPEIALDYFDFNSINGCIEADWVTQFKRYDFYGNFTECDSLKEIRGYVKTFERVLDLNIDDLTVMNDGVIASEHMGKMGKKLKKVIYSHRQIAEFVKAYPQAIFCSSV